MQTKLIEKIKDKIVFFDLDGTLSEYRYFDKVGPIELTGEILYKCLFEKTYDYVRPLATMQEVIKNLNCEKVYILGVTTLNREIEEKYNWLEKHYPSIKRENMIFVNSTETKLGVLEAYRKRLNLDYKDIIFVDDMHSTIEKVEQMGFIAYHPSSFID